MSRVSQTLDRIHATFDDDNLVANAGLLLPATLVNRLDIETLINATVRLDDPGAQHVSLDYSPRRARH